MFKSPIAWFEIVMQDFNRGVEFYENVFHVKLERKIINEMQVAIFPYEEGQTGGALVSSPCYKDHKPGAGTSIVYLNCESVTKKLETVAKFGGKTIFPIIQIGENGFIAGFEDSEGNHIGIWSKTA